MDTNNDIIDYLEEEFGDESDAGEEVDADAAIDEAIDEAEESVDDDAGDDGEEISEDAPQKSEAVHNEHNDALAAALAKLQQQESELQRTRNELIVAQAEQKRPQFVPYEELDDNTKALFDRAAERFGVPPETLVFNEYQRLVEEHRRNVESLQHRFETNVASARQDVDAHFQQHRDHAKHGQAVVKKLLELGWDNVDKLAQRDPDTFRHTAKVMIDLAYRDVALEAARAERSAKAKQAMKASTRSEASRGKAPITNKSSQSGDDVDFLDFFQQESGSWIDRLRKKK